MTIIYEIKKDCIERGITRLCHFTPSRKMAHILAGKKGILSSAYLEKTERDIFDPTDRERLDRRTGHICCSVEYPNAWYFDKTRTKELLFKDWVILFIKPHYLWKTGTEFCHRNASAGCGRYICEGYTGFNAMFNQTIKGAGDRIFKRNKTHLCSCPTDNQAEVLIPDSIGIDDIIGIAVMDKTQAKREIVRLNMQSIKCEIPIYISSDLFEKNRLSELIASGQKPQEIKCNGKTDE